MIWPRSISTPQSYSRNRSAESCRPSSVHAIQASGAPRGAVAEANTLIEAAAVQLAALLADDNQIDEAREVIRRALRSLHANESLYLCRMRIEHQAHNPTGIAKAFKDLTDALADYGLDPSTQARELARSFGIR